MAGMDSKPMLSGDSATAPWQAPTRGASTARGGLWKKVAIGCAIAAVVLGAGIVAGYFIGRARPAPANGGQPGAAAQDLQQLPPPGSAQAKALLADPSTPQHVRDLYQAANDTATITPELVGKFLARLQRKLADLGYAIDLQDHITLANIVVDLLRVMRADAILTLLRQYAETGNIVLQDVDMDALQQQANNVLQPSTLEKFLRYTAVRDVVESVNSTRDWPSALANATATLSAAVPGSGHRHLLQQQQQQQQQRRRRLLARKHRRSLKAAATIPVINGKIGDDVLPTDLPPMNLQDMLCDIAPWARGGRNNDTANCPPSKPKGRYQFNGVAFKPVTVPLVFHCMRWKDKEGVLQPPYWKPEEDAKHLVDATNKLYNGSGITFSLKEVRTDPAKFPYLLNNGSLEDWQACGSAPSTYPSFKCLSDIAKGNGDTTYAINVIVVGAVYVPAFCNFDDASAACNSLFLGYSNTNGPWMAAPSESWTEDDLTQNWIHITYDYISPDYKNARPKWDGGAATLAHEAGHYLGLRHTHEGACSGGGVRNADAVPDTPQNMDVQSYAGEKGITRELSKFCANWRNGQPYDLASLQAFKSCPATVAGNGTVDNIFNVLSYVPDPCVMIFSDNQVARLQWAMATFRPKLMARYSSR